MIKALIDKLYNNDKATSDGLSLELATAVFMMEVARVDLHFDAGEMARMIALLQRKFALTDAAAATLIERARKESEEAISLHAFASFINERYALEQRRELICNLWQIAYADDDLDRYEDHVIRKLADMLYLPHAQLVQARHRAIELMKAESEDADGIQRAPD